jgi:hypothetical protein
MPNHYHLALETPQPNLVEGMHWLQSTFGTRFNRFRSERGHLFQGRYQALLVEDNAALVRLINYIHLNPVRSGEITVDRMRQLPWCSLATFLAPDRPRWLAAHRLLSQLNLDDSPSGWATYVQSLIELAGDPEEQERQGFDEMTRGWAIGTLGWKRALAREYSHLALEVGWHAEEIRDFKEGRWRSALEGALAEINRTAQDVRLDASTVAWKIELAVRLRAVGASYRWIVEALNAGNVATLRNAVWRCQRAQRATA